VERWKDIKGYNGDYQISNEGRVRSFKTGSEVLKIQSVEAGGYLEVHLYRNNNRKHHKIHRLLLIHFVPNPLFKRCGNHKDGNKLNNDLSNLEWATYSENNKHAYNIGLKSLDGSVNFKSVKMFDLNGNFIKTFISMIQAQRETGTPYYSIGRCINHPHRYKTANGYQWRSNNENN